MLFFLILTKDQVGKLRQKCTLKCLIRSIVHWTCKRNKKKDINNKYNNLNFIFKEY
jgi:hypothetical protein